VIFLVILLKRLLLRLIAVDVARWMDGDDRDDQLVLAFEGIALRSAASVPPKANCGWSSTRVNRVGVYDAIASTLPKDAARWPMQRDRGQCFIQVEAAVVDRMRATRRTGESYRDVQARRTVGERRWAGDGGEVNGS
jgi:hypothetical protein